MLHQGLYVDGMLFKGLCILIKIRQRTDMKKVENRKKDRTSVTLPFEIKRNGLIIDPHTETFLNAT